MARAADFDLARELARPSFTPSVRDAPALVELLAAGDERAAAALARLGEAARVATLARLPAVDEAARARLVGALGRLGDTGVLIAQLADPSARVRRAAVLALGKLGGDAARAALVTRWDAGDVPPDERRALAEALGKAGGEAALSRLRALEAGGDAELARRRDRALLVAERDAGRDVPSDVAIDVPPPAPLTVRLHTKPGLGGLLVEELAARGLPAVPRGDAAAEIVLAGPWATLHASRLWATAGVRLPLSAVTPEAIVQALAAPATRALLAAWTRGPIRWRLGFPTGHRRAQVWRIARDVAAAAPELVNDPKTTTWDAIVDEAGPALELQPRRAADPRFAWRVADVPAASAPPVAAALAFVAGARDDDRVWDPFTGAGGELVERARLGPLRTLTGSDLADEALAAARANLAAAGVTAALATGDARTFAPGPVDLVITNPPLGSRVQLDAARLLADALPNLARALAPRGRLVWITPAPRKTGPIAERLGLVRTRALAVDLGGVRGQLERWDRR